MGVGEAGFVALLAFGPRVLARFRLLGEESTHIHIGSR